MLAGGGADGRRSPLISGRRHEKLHARSGAEGKPRNPDKGLGWDRYFRQSITAAASNNRPRVSKVSCFRPHATKVKRTEVPPRSRRNI